MGGGPPPIQPSISKATIPARGCRRAVLDIRVATYTAVTLLSARMHHQCCARVRRQLRVKLRNTQTEHSPSGFPPTADIDRIPGTVQRPPTQGAETSENCRPWARRKLAGGRVFEGHARGRLLCHRATAKPYCSSSSFVARQAHEGAMRYFNAASRSLNRSLRTCFSRIV
jgi:hypothetical protein